MNNNENDELTAIFASYTNELPTIVQEIKKLWNGLQIAWDNNKAIEFHRIIHNLKDSASMHGYQDISHITHSIQTIIHSSPIQNNLTVKDKNKISALISQLYAAVESIASRV